MKKLLLLATILMVFSLVLVACQTEPDAPEVDDGNQNDGGNETPVEEKTVPVSVVLAIIFGVCFGISLAAAAVFAVFYFKKNGKNSSVAETNADAETENAENTETIENIETIETTESSESTEAEATAEATEEEAADVTDEAEND